MDIPLHLTKGLYLLRVFFRMSDWGQEEEEEVSLPPNQWDKC